MKTLNLIKVAGALAATIAMTMTANAQSNSSIEQLNRELAKVSGGNSGLQVRFASKEAMESALQKVGGNATVEFSANKQLKLMKSGGVVIGSGADGLVATSNIKNSNDVVIPVPMPKTSITISLGNAQQKPGQVCALLISTDKQGAVIRGSSEPKICGVQGSPVRLLKGGFYSLSLSGTANSVTTVSINDGENKIIPVRSIIIPGNKSKDTTISFQVVRDYATGDIEKNKFALSQFVYEKYNSKTDCYDVSLSDFRKTCANYLAAKDLNTYEKLIVSASNSNGTFVGLVTAPEDKSPNYMDKVFIFDSARDFNGTSTAPFTELKDGNAVIDVLAGVYKIKWSIDGQFDVTKGIYVQ